MHDTNDSNESLSFVMSHFKNTVLPEQNQINAIFITSAPNYFKIIVQTHKGFQGTHYYSERCFVLLPGS